MTYFEFHAVFMLPPLVLLFWRHIRRGGLRSRHSLVHLAALAAIALLYTTPWDNYLVYRGVWSYGADRVAGTIGFVPVEEYVFFTLQPLLVGLFYLEVERFTRPAAASLSSARLAGCLFWLLLAACGGLLLRSAAGTYMGLILVWSAPVLAAMWGWAGHRFMEWRRPAFLTVLAASFYLWIADRIAIGLGIWEISPTFTTGFSPLGLPIEEAAFFFLTSLLVVQGLILFRHPPRGRTAAAPALR